MKSVEGRKEGKDKEINIEAIRPVKMGKKEVKSQSVSIGCSLEELCECEQVKEEKNRVREKRVVNDKKKKFFLFKLYL